MGIQVICQACGRSANVKAKYAGQTGGCPYCHAPLRIPDSTATPSGPARIDDDDASEFVLLEEAENSKRTTSASGPASQHSTGYVRFGCPRCGRRMKVESRLAGKKTTCNGCQFAFVVPQAC